MIRFCIKKINSLCYAVPYVFDWLGGHAIWSNYWMRLSMIWRIMQMEKGVAEVNNSFRVLHNTAALCHIYPANKASFCLLEWGGEKEVQPESPQTFEVTASRTSRLVNLGFFFCQTFFFECERRFIDKSLRITEPAVPSARLLVLGSKLYPSSMQRMLNKDLTWFTQSLFRVRRNQAGERKALDDRPPPVIDIKLNSMIVSLFI